MQNSITTIDLTKPATQAMVLQFADIDGGAVQIEASSNDGLHLDDVADLVRRFLLAAGFSVDRVTFATDYHEYTSEGA